MGHAVRFSPVFALLLLGCSHEPPARSPAAPVRATGSADTATTGPTASVTPAPGAGGLRCPQFGRRTRVVSQPIAGGVELVFWTPGDTARLRDRVSALPLPPAVREADLRTDNIHNGIRLVFEPEKPTDIVPLRLAVHDYAKEVASQCGVRFAPPRSPKPAKHGSNGTHAAQTASPPEPAKPSSPAKPASPDSKKAPTSTTKAAKKPAPATATPAPKQPASTAKQGPIPNPFQPPGPNRPGPPTNPFK